MYIPSEPLHNSYYNNNTIHTTTTTSSTSTTTNTYNNTNTTTNNTNNTNTYNTNSNSTTAIPNRGPKIGGRENYSDYSAVEVKACIESFYNHYNIEEVQILG